MPISVNCPNCGKRGRLPDGFHGKATCRACGTRFGIEVRAKPEEAVESPLAILEPAPVTNDQTAPSTRSNWKRICLGLASGIALWIGGNLLYRAAVPGVNDVGGAQEVDPVPFVDPHYAPEWGATAALFRPGRPGGPVPFVEDLDTYFRVHDHLENGHDDLVSSADRMAIHWAPAGTKVKILSMHTQKDLDDYIEILRQRAEHDPPYRPGFDLEVAKRRPWIKVVQFLPNSDYTYMDMRHMGFTLMGFVGRPYAPSSSTR